MSNKGVAETQQPKASGPKFSIEKLSGNCRALFGVSPTTFAGATHGLKGEYTVNEMKAHIDKWQKKPATKEAK